jgi:hypothetical protein
MSWTGAGTVCNWKMEPRWTTTSGSVYRTDSSAVHVGCRAVSAVWERDFGPDVFSPTYGSYWSGMQMRTEATADIEESSAGCDPGAP